jgi:hypothetical protein
MKPSISRARRRRIAAVIAAVPACTGLVVAYGQSYAGADTLETNQKMNCPIIGALDTPFTASDTPDPVPSAGSVQLDVMASAPVPPGISVTIDSLTLEFPLPAQVAKVDGVTFSGGNMTGSFQAAADKVSVTYTGPQPAEALALPTAQIKATLKPGTEAVSWPGPTGIATVIAGLGPQNCTAVAGNPPLQVTSIVGGTPSPAPSATPTTKPSAPTTTAPGAGTPKPVTATPKFTG